MRSANWRLLGLAGLACCSARRPEEVAGEAMALQRAGRLGAAFVLARGGEERAARDHDSDQVWRFRLLEAEIVLDREEGDPIPDLAGFPARLAAGPEGVRLEKVRARAALAARDYPEADIQLKRAEAGERASGSLRPDVEVLATRAQWLANQGRMEEAEAVLGRTLTDASDASTPYWRAHALAVIAHIRSMRDLFADALAPTREALALSRQVGADGLTVRLLWNLGISEYRLGDLDLGRTQLEESARLAESIKADYDLPYIIGELGTICLLRHDVTAAITQYQRALEIARKSARSAEQLWTLNLTEAYVTLENWPMARRFAKETEALFRSSGDLGDLPYLTLHQAKIALGSGDSSAAERKYLEVIDAAGERANLRWQAESDLGELYARRGNFKAAAELFERSLRGVEQVRSSLTSIDERLPFLTHLIDLYDNYVSTLVSQGRSEAALGVVLASRARILSAGLGRSPLGADGSTFDPRKEAARQGAVLISYWIGAKRSFAWAITPTTVESITLPGRPELEALVERQRASVEDSLRDPRTAPASPGRELYDLLIAPFARHMPPGSAVVIEPDGPLYALPFSTLVVPGPPSRYLIEDVQITLAPSLALLATRPSGSGHGPRHGGPGRLLAIGDPLDDGVAFPRLPGAAQELAAIRGTFTESSIAARELARPEAYLRDDLASFDLIHFAAHAVANAVSPLDSTIVLSPGALGRRRLSVRDVLARHVNAELVTLSACRAAGARVYSGEGLVGFSWAFLSAGARQVVAGQWDVGDGSTAELMGRFYRYLRENDDPSKALRRAQLALLASDDFRGPYHWAAFNVYRGPGASAPP